MCQVCARDQKGLNAVTRNAAAPVLLRLVHQPHQRVGVAVLRDHGAVRDDFASFLVSPLAVEASQCPWGAVSTPEAFGAAVARSTDTRPSLLIRVNHGAVRKCSTGRAMPGSREKPMAWCAGMSVGVPMRLAKRERVTSRLPTNGTGWRVQCRFRRQTQWL